MSNEPSIFVDGLRISKPKDNAPDWIKADCVINCDELEQYIRANRNESGEIRFQIKESKAGRLYCAVDTWQPQQQNTNQQPSGGYDQQSNNSQTPEQQPGSPAPFPTDSQEDQLGGLEDGEEDMSSIPF